jgi:hypothetical protein
MRTQIAEKVIYGGPPRPYPESGNTLPTVAPGTAPASLKGDHLAASKLSRVYTSPVEFTAQLPRNALLASNAAMSTGFIDP